MIKKRLNYKLILFAIGAIVSCQQDNSELIKRQAYLRNIERQDHQKCISQGIDIGALGEATTELYWRCRFDLIQARKNSESITPEAIEHNATLKIASDDILKRWNRSRQAFITTLEDDADTVDHAKCLAVGNVESEDEKQVDAYYRCRQKLALRRKSSTTSITNSYETSLLNKAEAENYFEELKNAKNLEADVAFVDKMMHSYPACGGLKVQSDEFRKCAEANDDAKKCVDGLAEAKTKKSIQDKMYCTNQAFIQFPDNYALSRYKSASQILKDKKAKEEKNAKKLKEEEKEKADLQYVAGNIDEIEYFENVAEEEKKDEQEENKKTNVYNKIELTRIREQFIIRCNKSMEQKIDNFAKKFLSDCAKIAINWDKK